MCNCLAEMLRTYKTFSHMCVYFFFSFCGYLDVVLADSLRNGALIKLKHGVIVGVQNFNTNETEKSDREKKHKLKTECKT